MVDAISSFSKENRVFSLLAVSPRQDKRQNKTGFYVRGVFTTLLSIKSKK